MKTLVNLCLSLVTITNSAAQIVTINRESAPVEYYRMPDQPIDPSYTTYSVDISMRTGELFRTGLTEASLENQYLFISGYQRVLDRGDVHVEASIGDFNVYGERRGTQQTKSKDKDGKEIIRTQYYMELRYSQPMALRVTDKKSRTLEDEYIYHMSDDQTWRSPHYNSLSDLDRYWRSSRTYKLAELQKNRIMQGMKVISDKINNNYGYRLINENERFEKIGRKKHPAYGGYDNAVETIKQAFKLMDANKSLEEVRKTVQPAIDFYKDADSKCGTADKEDLKLKHIGLYNLALIYFWLEDFEMARQYAEEIYKLDTKDKEAKKLLEQIDYVASSILRAQRSSRHQIVIGGKA